MPEGKFAFSQQYEISKMLLWNKNKTEFAFWWSLERIERVINYLAVFNYQVTLTFDFLSEIYFYQIAMFRTNY